MLLKAVVFCVVVATVRGSPNAEFVENLIRDNFFGPISDDVYEDALLDVPDLVKKYKYPVEQHLVTTPDGYVLGMHRIPHGRDNNTEYGNKPVVFVMHGILCSSADWVLTGPGKGLAYVLAEEGFDVWLGNQRGNYYSRRHISLNPDDKKNTAFWQFTLDDMGNYDLTSMIDYILKTTGRPNLHYIGYSQGTTNYFIMGALRPEYSEKVLSAHNMAPVVYKVANRTELFDTLSPIAAAFVTWLSNNGIGEVFPKSELMAWIGRTFCSDKSPTQPLCTLGIFLLTGWSENQHNASMLPIGFAHTPAGASIRQFAHLTQNVAAKSFRRFDYGAVQNLLRYGTAVPPEYNLKNIKTPVFLYYSYGDTRIPEDDVTYLFTKLNSPKYLFPLEERAFNHVDFMWGMNAKGALYDKIISEIRKIENSRT